MATASLQQVGVIQKDEARFYVVDGVQYPSVTTVISATLVAPELQNWREHMAAKTGSTRAANAIRDAAAAKGTMLHEAAAQIAQGEEFIPFTSDETFIDGVLAFEEWLRQTTVEILAVEQVVVSRIWGYAGRLDIVRRKTGRKTYTLTDYKTRGSSAASGLYPAHRLQTAAYVQAFRESFPGVRIDDREVALVSREADADQRIRIFTLHDQPHDFTAFANLLGVYRWLKSEHR